MSTRACVWTPRSSCRATCPSLTRSWATTHNGHAHSYPRRSSSVNLPIGLTLTRIVAVPLLIVFLISSSRVHAVIAAAIFILAAITDWADGMLARRRNQVTTLGTLLDPIADKLLVAAALVSLLAIDKIDAWIVVVIVGRELAVTGLRAVAASVGVIVPASRLAKWKTVSQYVASAILAIGAAYLIGAVPVGYLVGRAFGVADIRQHGSGTIGATNVLRTAGWLPAILTLGGDTAKGYLAVVAGAALGAGAPGSDAGVLAASAVAAVIGNCWSVFLGFRGGKGVATGLGPLLKIVPLVVVPAALVWLEVNIS